VSWILIFGIGLFAQFCIAKEMFAFGLFLYMGCGAAVFYRYVYRFAGSLVIPEDLDSTESIKTDANLWLILAGLLAALTSMMLAGGASIASKFLANLGIPIPIASTYPAAALLAWIMFLACMGIAPYKRFISGLRTFSWKKLLPLGCLLLLALLLGVYRLTSIPPTVHGDEGMVGIHARQILEGHLTTFFSLSWYEIPQFFFLLPAASMAVFGDSLFGLRMGSVLQGMVSVIPFYLLAQAWWGKKAAIFSSLLLVGNHWFLFLMHSGVNYVQGMLFANTLLCLWYFSNAKRSIALSVFAGIIIGFGLLSYQANHILPLLWISSQCGLWLLRYIDGKWFCLSILIPFGIAGLLVAPWVTTAFDQTHDQVIYTESASLPMFSSRATSVVIWSDQGRQHLDSVYHTNGDFDIILREQLRRAFLAPIHYTDHSMQYLGDLPLLDHVSAVFFMLAVWIGCFLFFDFRWGVLLLWSCAILLIGGAFTLDAPFYPRLVGSTGILFLLIGGVFSIILRQKRGTFLSSLNGVIISLCAGAALFINAAYFFDTYANETNVRNAHFTQTQVAHFILERDPKAFTIMFLVKNGQGRNITRIPTTWNSAPFTVIIDAGKTEIVSELQEEFPGVKLQHHQSPLGDIIFYSLSVE